MRINDKFKPIKRRNTSLSKKYLRDNSKTANISMRYTYVRVKPIEPVAVLENVPSDIYNWGLVDLNIPQIHKESLGEGIKIGVIDTGKPEHIDLINRIVAAENFTKDESVIDRSGHSTFVCGLIAAERNDRGIVGVAPLSELYIAKALRDSGRGTPDSLTRAVKWCREQKVDLITISAGFNVDYPPLHDEIKQAYRENITILAAAGNSGVRFNDIFYPAKYDEVIAVAAYDKDRKVTEFSSRGINVMFAMPGADLYSTWLNNSYTSSSGTSFACPILTGICALIISSHRKRQSQGSAKTPCNTPKEVIQHLQKYSIKLGEQNETGFGTVDVQKILELDI